MKRRKKDTRTDMLHVIREFLRKRYNVQPSDVNMYTNLRSDLGLDSLAVTDLSVELQEMYGVILSEEAMHGTVAEMIEEIIE